MRQSLPPLITALLEPERYPERPDAVELVETHASWLLLAGGFAYKIKKPVKLPFLDYGTLEQRRLCCEAELRLNCRLSPALYLGVVAICGSPQDPQIGGHGEPIEFAVKMRRFAEAGRLDRVCARGELTLSEVSALAAAVAAFHCDAAIAPIHSRFGLPEQVLAPALQNFSELQELLPQPADQARLAPLLAWTRASFSCLEGAFAARKAAGNIRECHGDLHLANLVLIDARVSFFDCVEFSEDLRWIDVASEIAFTYIDLVYHRQPGLASWFLSEWLSYSGDYAAVTVVRFYAVYRALVRAKVAAIRAGQGKGDGDGDGDGDDREGDGDDCLAAARDYLGLAERLSAPPAPQLIITHGLSGCGKTRASQKLLLDDPHGTMLRLRSDVERKRLFGLSATANSGADVAGGIYQPAANALTYRRLRELTENLLVAGWSVVVDAAFLKRAERSEFRLLANQLGVAFLILAPPAAPEELRERIVVRLAKQCDASEATPEVLAMQMREIEALDSTERQSILENSGFS